MIEFLMVDFLVEATLDVGPTKPKPFVGLTIGCSRRGQEVLLFVFEVWKLRMAASSRVGNVDFESFGGFSGGNCSCYGSNQTKAFKRKFNWV